MQIDFSQQIHNLDGSSATTGGERCQMCGSVLGGESKPLILKHVVSRALIQPEPQEQGEQRQRFQGLDKGERAMLALRIFDATEPLDLDSSKITVIKEYVDRMWPPVTVAQANELLEGRENPFERE